MQKKEKAVTDEGNAPRVGIGSRVRCNKCFAAAFEGQTGTITASRVDAFGETLWTVTFDTPTPAATNWTPLETIAASANCYDLITDKGTSDEWSNLGDTQKYLSARALLVESLQNLAPTTRAQEFGERAKAFVDEQEVA